MTSKWASVSAKVTQKEKELIISKAKNNGMSVNEYVKNRLLYDPELFKLNEYQQDLITTTRKSYNLLQIIAKNTNNITSEKIITVLKQAEQKMIEKGYLDQNSDSFSQKHAEG